MKEADIIMINKVKGTGEFLSDDIFFTIHLKVG